MTVTLESNGFFMGIEYVAVFCCGLLGGLAAIRKGYDLFAIVLTAWLTALGGGIVRDVILGALPPVGISDRAMVLTCLAAGLIVAVIHPEVNRLKWSMLVLDALALGLFAVNGTQKALMYGTSGMTAVFLGMFTALAGGLIRDMLLNEVPMAVRDRHWYAFPSLVGCMLTVVSYRLEGRGIIPYQGEIIFDIAIVIVVVLMRVLSVRFDIKLPGAVPRDKPVDIVSPIHRRHGQDDGVDRN
ncbi:trimeric intracellular cation channel family protein [Bifidobacterium thermophilum]|uniref:trimeric intracellular cation channel family protein n=1 Tax=Bifidobacterium thermophilum TaxID=33905 RepID=UPI0030A79A82